MSDKPQGQSDGIIDQTMDAGRPEAVEQAAATSGQPRKKDHPAAKGTEKGPEARPRKITPVFIYMAILFAAAFLMLLLAYFIQRRNSENTIDDLRSSMTATREDLMAQNQQLQEERDGLQATLDRLEDKLRQTVLERDKAEAEASQWKAEAEKSQISEEQLQLWKAFWKMEEHYVRGEYEECAEAFQVWYDVPEEVLWRAEEIYEDLVTQGYMEQTEGAG